MIGSRNHVLRTFAGLLVILAVLAGSAQAVSKLVRYAPAPGLDLHDIEGPRVTSKTLKGRPAVLIFGELYNRNTIRALKEVNEVRTALEVGKKKVPVYLVVAQSATAEDLRAARAKRKVTATVLHDPSRSAFGAYKVIVLPSTVVLDAKGNVCMAVSGYPLAFADLVTDATRYALGKLTRRQFEEAGKASTRPALDESRVQAGRLAGLARQLFRRGLPELALARYDESLKLDEAYLPARVGLARCLIQLGRLDQAEAHLQKALKVDKNHLDANLAMGYVEIFRGGDEIKAARTRLDRVLLRSPHNAEAHYLNGLVYEAQDQTAKALREFKKAAEILLEVKK